MADRVVDGGRRRSRGGGGEAAKRADALERLKAIRQGNRSDFQVKIQEPIYDTVEEKDYAALVAKRRQESGDFIVDDDGLGYVDKGEEEDWSITGLPPSSDESGDESEKPKKRRPEKKNPTAIKPPPSASSAGNRRLSAMFTSSVLKKPKEDDRNKGSSLLDEIMASEAVDEVERQKRRRGRVGFVSFTPIAPCSVKREGMPGVMSQMGLNPCANSLARMGVQGNVDLGGDKDVVVELKHEVMVDFGDRDVVVESKDEKMVDFGENSDGLGKTNGSEINGSMVSEAPVVVSEAKITPAMKMKDDEFALNARVKGDADPALSATAGWQEVCNVENGNTCDRVESNDAINSEQKSEFELDSDGSMPFYIIDAHEEFGSTTGNLYLFGKVKTGSTYHSCCVVVKNMQRCVYAIPKDSVLQNDVIGELEKDVAESRISPIIFRTKLHELTSGLKSELREKLLDLNVSKVAMSPVKRSYAFERSDIPIGEHYVLKICYLFKDPPLPTNLKGEQFSALLGTHSSALELFLIKRKIKGPSWLSISKFTNCSVPQRVSWCKFEVTVEDPKDIRVSSSKPEVPPLIVSAVNLKTIVNEKHNVNEIVAASVVFCRNAKIDTPTEWDRLGGLGHFSVVRKLDGGIFPMGFTKEVTDRNSKAGINVLAVESSERALLNRLMLELHRLDSDVLVGHNISGFDLDVLLHRAQACKVPSSMWSKIGRLKRSAMPKLTKGGTIFGSGASLGIMSCISGRLLCDTYLCSRDLLKEVSYSLTHLAKTQLGKDRKEIAPHDISNMFQSSGALMQLIECGETDAWLSMGLMFHLSVLPLTRQLTNISGNLWGKTLQGARAQRVEYLLLHAFHAKKYIVPDKISAREKETSSTKRRIAHPTDGDDANDMNGFPSENDFQNVEQGKSKKGPAYAGGLVLEPKKGLYDKYILLLDFNSLYPSIIQEYNICFTTVERSTNESIPRLPTSKTTGVLPELLRNLVERRKQVKTWLKKESGLKAKQYDIQQQALKLTANSMYGCLGFSNSRFYAKPLAELITLQGREILQSTVDLVQNNLNLEVIYGDTDSIMIYSGLDDIANAKSIAGKVIQEVNKKYRCLEIDLDGLYKRMLLLKKKKYAAVKVQFENGKQTEVTECKGLDMVRRDWSLLSKELGNFCLHQILSGGSCEDVVESIHSRLMKDQDDMRNGRVELEKYVITKTLTKPPEAYPDAKNQPHVQVALRLKAAGYSTECSAGDTVRYVICCEQGTRSTSKGIAHRARHPDELTKGNGNWIIDIDYYLAQQIHPVVSRLCAPIQGTSPARLADCLGLDSSKFQSKTSETVGNSSSPSLLSIVDDEERYSGCEPLRLSCPTCSGTFECPSVSSFMLTTIGETATVPQAEEEFSNSFWRTLRCSKCPSEGDGGRISPVMISNQVKQQADGFISMYYKSLMMCDDETCKYTTRGLNLRVIGESEKGTICPNYPHCNGHLIRKYTEVDLYKQLAYFCHVLDAVRFVEKLDLKTRMPFGKELARIQQVVGLAASIVQKIRDRCAYGWIQMKDLTISF